MHNLVLTWQTKWQVKENIPTKHQIKDQIYTDEKCPICQILIFVRNSKNFMNMFCK